MLKIILELRYFKPAILTTSIFILSLFSAIINGQEIQLHFNDGTPVVSYEIISIDSITFIFDTDCPDSLIDTRDGRFYQTILINNQCWMAENLNIGERIDGYIDPSDDELIEKYCYDDDEENCDKYGGLYQWDEMMQYSVNEGIQGICPEGWHIPTDQEWYQMEHFLDPSISPNSTNWRGYNCGMQLLSGGSSGFDALLAGIRNQGDGDFLYIGETSYFWSSSLHSSTPNNSWYRMLNKDHPESYRNTCHLTHGASLRCIKNH